jgi:hypothetical protein
VVARQAAWRLSPQRHWYLSFVFLLFFLLTSHPDRILKLLRESVKQYDVSLPDAEFAAQVPPAVVSRYRNGQIDNNLCGVMERKVSWLSHFAEEPSGTTPLYTILAPLRYRIYSTVLNNVIVVAPTQRTVLIASFSSSHPLPL